MSEFKEGDRIKVTLEGFAHDVYPRGLTMRSVDGLYVADVRTEHPDVTIEKLPDPLPTTPGSVIRRRGTGSLYFRSLGYWRSHDGSKSDPGEPSLYEVVFDAGAER